MALREVEIDAVPPKRLAPIIGAERTQAFERLQAEAAERFAGRTVWNINSTATGGGVAELLQVLLAYARGAGVDTRWVVIDGNPPFFAATKRLHNRLHGVAGDRGALGPDERRGYEQVMQGNSDELERLVRSGDVVLLHDPQTLGLAARLREAGAIVVWRCHVGSDLTNQWTDEGWAFLEPFLAAPDAFVFSRKQYIPGLLDGRRVAVIPPSIDPFSPKNQDIDEAAVAAVLRRSGLVAFTADSADAGGAGTAAPYARRNGAQAEIEGRADVVEEGPPPPDAPLIVQVSRWDRLKDMQGVMEAFAAHVAPEPACQEVHLTLAGPSVKGVADDPEGAEVLEECTQAWRGLPAGGPSRPPPSPPPPGAAAEKKGGVAAPPPPAAPLCRASPLPGVCASPAAA